MSDCPEQMCRSLVLGGDRQQLARIKRQLDAVRYDAQDHSQVCVVVDGEKAGDWVIG